MAELSADIILRYYENEPLPFLSYMDEDALWYGPALGQFIEGRDAMMRAWSGEDHALKFTVGDMKTKEISSTPAACSVMLTYSVVTHYPDGHDISVNQRLLLCWGERKVAGEAGKMRKEPRILVCHISNPHGKHDEDVIYPKHFDQVYTGAAAMPQKGERLHFHGVDHSEYFFFSDSIYCFEAAFGGKHSVLHTSGGKYEVQGSVDSFAKKYPRLFLRCHRSFLINPHYIRNISRFRVTLTNGTEVPIPEKKYTAFKDRVVKILKK